MSDRRPISAMWFMGRQIEREVQDLAQITGVSAGQVFFGWDEATDLYWIRAENIDGALRTAHFHGLHERFGFYETWFAVPDILKQGAYWTAGIDPSLSYDAA